MREIELINNRGTILVDDSDYAQVAKYKWRGLLTRGRVAYACTGRSTLLHQLLTGCKELVDHVNGNGLDNTRGNLRCASSSDNNRNSSRPLPACCPYRGVRKRKSGRWQAYSQYRQTRRTVFHTFGIFSSPEEAAAARDAGVRNIYQAFGRYNFPAIGEANIDGIIRTV